MLFLCYNIVGDDSMAKLQKRKKPIIKGILENHVGVLEITEDAIDFKLISNIVIEDHINESIQFDTCHLKNVTFSNNEFERAEFIDMKFENCDLSNNSFINSSFHRCEFIDCKFTGSHFVETLLQDVLISNGMAKFIDIANTKLNKVEIFKSDFSESNWFDATLKHVIIDDTILNKSTIYKTKFRGIDLSTSSINDLKVDIESIKGSIIAPWQAKEVCHLLGIKIK